MRILCWFSCGSTSAVATKKAIETYGLTHEVIPVCCDTRPSEHSDNYRFSKECERWFGRPILYLRSDKYETVDEVFEETRYMAGPHGARCTTELKKKPRQAFERQDDIHVWGFSVNEKRRIADFEANNPELHCLWILRDLGLSKQNCLTELLKAGIELPQMYHLGFDNNNCPGCVKASSKWYWNHVRTHFPEVFKRRCEQSRKLGVRLVEVSHHVRIFLDELPPGPFKKRGKKEAISCGPDCGGRK